MLCQQEREKNILCNNERINELYILNQQTKREKDINEIFSKFPNPKNIKDVLNENEEVVLYGFKEYKDYISIVYTEKKEELDCSKQLSDGSCMFVIIDTETVVNKKVCITDAFTKHVLKNLQEKGYFSQLTDDETAKTPVYLMPYKQLRIKKKNYLEIFFINYQNQLEFIKEDDKVIEEILKNWNEIQILTKMEEVFELNTKPTIVLDLQEGEYTAHKYFKRVFRGKPQIIAYILREDNTEIPILGSWLTHELEKIDLTKTLAPINILIGGRRHAVTSDVADRYTTITSTQVE